MTKMAILGRGSMRDKQKVSFVNEISLSFWGVRTSLLQKNCKKVNCKEV